MQQLTYIKKGVLQWWDVEEPALGGPREAIVRPFVAARCDLDNLILLDHAPALFKLGAAVRHLAPNLNEVLGPHPFRGPYAYGHECIGQILAAGSAVTRFRPGQIVIVPWAISCGTCLHCNTGLSSKCTANDDTVISAYGFGDAMGPWGGAVSDRIRVPYADAMLVEVPDGVDPVSIASASDNLPDAWRTVGPPLRERPRAPVLVVGGSARSIGLYAAAMAVAIGASQVDYVDSDRARLELAESVGAKAIEAPGGAGWYRQSPPPSRGGYPITVDASASPARLSYALRCLSPGGVCTSAGIYFQAKASVPLWDMYVNGSTLRTGLSNARDDIPDVLRLVQETDFEPQRITTLLADWNDAPQALLEPTTKVVLRRDPLIL